MLKLHPVGGLVILKANPHQIVIICASFQLSYTQCHGRIHPLAFNTQHAEWVTMSLQLFNTSFFSFLSLPDTVSSDIDLAYLFLLILLIFWHCDMPPLFPVFPTLTRSAVSVPGGRMEHSKPLHLWGNSKTPCPPWSICHHVECQEVSLGLASGHRSPWHFETEKERNRDTEKKREEQRENEPYKGPETDPSRSAEPGEYAARLSAPLISQIQPLWQCDTDYWKPWFRLSLLHCVAEKQRQLKLHTLTHTHTV